jgi:hypothetical protein
VADYKPQGYKSKVDYDGGLTVEDLLLASPIAVFYDKVETELSKNIIVKYQVENDEGTYDTVNNIIINVSETQFYDGLMLKDIISVDAYRPNASYYNKGYIEGHSADELIVYESVESNYVITYPKAVNTIFVEYYAGTYPNWYRLTSLSV